MCYHEHIITNTFYVDIMSLRHRNALCCKKYIINMFATAICIGLLQYVTRFHEIHCNTHGFVPQRFSIV